MHEAVCLFEAVFVCDSVCVVESVCVFVSVDMRLCVCALSQTVQQEREM